MKESPIIFSAPMVRAILNRNKTQTRRIVKPQPFGPGKMNPGIDKFFYRDDLDLWWGVPNHIEEYDPSPSTLFEIKCPYGKPGDLLWVRETWAELTKKNGDKKIVYAADGKKNAMTGFPCAWNWKPSIHMFKADARLWLKITDIRVERLQEISEEDAVAEGISKSNGRWTDYRSGQLKQLCLSDPIDSFRTLWDSINAKRAPWESNPWVWVISFERTVEP